MSGLDTRNIDLADAVRSPAPEVEQRFRIFISQDAFDRVTTRGDNDTTREIGGILVGEICREEAGAYVRVDTTIDALHAEEKGTELTFTHATWDHVHAEMDRHYKDKRILGWYHTHPGFGIFLSDRDQFIHKSFFNLPYQIALVYDPKSHEHGVFAWERNEPARCLRYWVGPREQVWRPPAPPEPTTMETTTQETPKRPPADPPPPELDRLSLLTAALVLLVLGGLVGWWVGTGTARAALAEANAQLKRQGNANAQEIVKGLQSELLLLLHRSLGGDAVRGPIQKAMNEIAEAVQALEKEPGDKKAVARLRAARVSLHDLHETHQQADRTLRALANASHQDRLDPGEVARVLRRQSAAFGQVCVELADAAAQGGDIDRARRVLELAAHVDPDKGSHYRRKLDELEKKR